MDFTLEVIRLTYRMKHLCQAIQFAQKPLSAEAEEFTLAKAIGQVDRIKIGRPKK